MSDDYIIPGPEVFAAYLGQLHSEAVCGKRQAFCNCPVSEWLRGEVFLTAMSIDVDITEIELHFIHQTDTLETPAWIFAFVQAIDQGNGGVHMSDVTAGEALATLAKVMEGVA